MYIIIGYDINTPLVTMYEIMTQFKHRMLMAGPMWRAVVPFVSHWSRCRKMKIKDPKDIVFVGQS